MIPSLGNMLGGKEKESSFGFLLAEAAFRVADIVVVFGIMSLLCASPYDSSYLGFYFCFVYKNDYIAFFLFGGLQGRRKSCTICVYVNISFFHLKSLGGWQPLNRGFILYTSGLSAYTWIR